MASPQLQTIIEMLRKRPSRIGTPLAEMRAGLEMLASVWPVDANVQQESVDAGGVPGRWISASNATAVATLYWLHGGGYSIGSINTHAALIARLSKASGARAFAIDYRLAPEHPFPAALEDATKAYRWLLGQGVHPESIVIGGDSAGGGLTVATLVALRDAGDPLPGAAVLISPWTDLEGTGASMKTRAERDPMIKPGATPEVASMYYGSTSPRNPLVSPIYADLAGLPPILIHVGDAEVLLDDSTRLAERAKAVGVDVTLDVWDEMIHVWHFFASMLPEGQQAIERIGQYMRQRVAAGAPA